MRPTSGSPRSWRTGPRSPSTTPASTGRRRRPRPATGGCSRGWPTRSWSPTPGGATATPTPPPTELLGYAREELLGLRVEDVVAAEPSWTAAEFARFRDEGRWHGRAGAAAQGRHDRPGRGPGDGGRPAGRPGQHLGGARRQRATAGPAAAAGVPGGGLPRPEEPAGGGPGPGPAAGPAGAPGGGGAGGARRGGGDHRGGDAAAGGPARRTPGRGPAALGPPRWSCAPSGWTSSPSPRRPPRTPGRRRPGTG